MACDTSPNVYEAIVTLIRAAHAVHRRLGSGWPRAIYRDALMLMLREQGVSTRKVATRRGRPSSTAGLICEDNLLVQIEGPPLADERVRRDLRRCGLANAVLLRFDGHDVSDRWISARAASRDVVAGNRR